MPFGRKANTCQSSLHVRGMVIRHIKVGWALFFGLACSMFVPICHAVEKTYGGNIDAYMRAHDGQVQIGPITFSCDIPLAKKEFFYVTELKPHSVLTNSDINRAYKFLSLKRRFNVIAFDVIEEQADKRLHITLTANWVFKKLDLEGIWFGRSRYTSLYTQQPGDVFDVHLHEASLVAIQQYLYDHGYFTSYVTDEIEYSKKSKVITVRIKIKKMKRFIVKGTTVTISDAQRYQNHDINGDFKTLVDTITAKFSKLHETPYSKKQLKKVIHKIRGLCKEKGFVNARFWITRSEQSKKPLVDLTLKIHLGKRKVIRLDGNVALSADYIKQEFLSKDTPNWLFSQDIITQQLLHEYYKKGYWHTKISTNAPDLTGYHFSIKEGQPAIIEKVVVLDATSKIHEASSMMLSEALKNKPCDQALLDENLDRLKESFIAKGFWDFKLIEQQFVKNQKTGLYTVRITIDMGTQRLFGGIDIAGFKNIRKSDFFKKYRLIKPSQRVPFNMHWIQEQRDFLLGYFQRLGYWYVEVEPLLVVLSSPELASLTDGTVSVLLRWKIKRGPNVRFGKTILRGSSTVSFDRIKRQCAFKEGEEWDRDKIDRTRKRLKQLDVFKTVQIQPFQLAKSKGKKPIIVTVVDDDPIELRARVGYFVNSNNVLFKRDSTPKLGASVILKNPTGRADHISAAGDWNKFDRKVLLDYQLPSPFGTSLMSTSKVFASKVINPVEVKNSGSAYQALEYGFLTGIKDQYREYYSWNINVGNEWLKITRVEGNLKYDKNLINTTLPYFFVEPGFEVDWLDSHVNTTKGFFGKADIKMMAPENDGEVMARLRAEGSVFYPLIKQIVVAAHLRIGHVFNRRFDKIPPTERFYLGGPNSVRGYEPDALPPLGVTEVIEDGKLVKKYTIQGGSSMVNASLELRFPIYQSFGAVLFQDFGILSQSGFPGFKDRWYPGSGFGLRYKTPIGSIRFDIGWKWKRRLKEDTKSYAWYLTIGEAF